MYFKPENNLLSTHDENNFILCQLFRHPPKPDTV